MARPAIYLDDGGVINDSRERSRQWYPLVAKFFVPRLGGTALAWAEANYTVNARTPQADSQVQVASVSEYASYDRQRKIDWLRAQCELVGVPAPSGEECIALSRAAYQHITRNVHSALPGAVDTIKALSRRGYVLRTASGESSEDLDGYLEGTGVRECFDRLYGPDLVGTLKDGPRFYERILEDSRVAARDTLVVDDNPAAIGWATRAGVRAVLIAIGPPSSAVPTHCIPSLAPLPALIEQLEGERG